MGGACASLPKRPRHSKSAPSHSPTEEVTILTTPKKSRPWALERLSHWTARQKWWVIFWLTKDAAKGVDWKLVRYRLESMIRIAKELEDDAAK